MPEPMPLEELAKHEIIQGGMGAGVSNYHLARTVSSSGQFGVVSGTGIDTIMIRRLQRGGKMAEDTISALREFPNQDIADMIIEKFSPETRPDNGKYLHLPMPKFMIEDRNVLRLDSRDLEAITVAANFVEVMLAKRGHDGPVGVNLLYKIQWPLLPGMYGAMLAGADAILMGAGIPKPVPDALDQFAAEGRATMPIEVTAEDKYRIAFDPSGIVPEPGNVTRSHFLGIISSHLLLRPLKNADGYIVEGHVGGGHNAPARSKQLDEKGQPLYSEKDETKLKFMRSDDKPFWLAGGYGNRLGEALVEGAAGVQVGTPFAYCTDSGVDSELRGNVIGAIMEGAEIFTDPLISPTGFPFKYLPVEGTLSDAEVYEERNRVCDLRYLVELYETPGGIMTRCPSEPVKAYTIKGGNEAATEGRGCLCNTLMATIGLGSPNEPALMTGGSASLGIVWDLVKEHGPAYDAKAVIDYVEATR